MMGYMAIASNTNAYNSPGVPNPETLLESHI